MSDPFMTKKRKFILVFCIIEFLVFLLFSAYIGLAFPLVLIFLFAILSWPVVFLIWSVIWTLFIFDVIWFFSLKYNLKSRIVWTAVVVFNVYFWTSTLLAGIALFTDFDFRLILLIIANLIAGILVLIYVITQIIKLIKWILAKVRGKEGK